MNLNLPKCGLTAAMAILSPFAADAAAKCEQPNIIIILLDDLGSSDVGFGGCRDYQTPNIDKIANNGVVCTNAYISAPFSGPSRCGLLTGRYQQRFGAETNTSDYLQSIKDREGVPFSEVILSEELKKSGYQTCAIGKWHLGDHPDLWPNKRGFDYFYGFSVGSYNYWGYRENETKAYIQENGVEVPFSRKRYLTDDFSDKAVEYINGCDEQRPMFMYLAYNAPHAPLQAPQRYLDRTKHIYNAERSVYAAMMLAVDDGVGRVMEALEKRGMDDNTLIFFLSDNGGPADTGADNIARAFKGNMFDGGIRTPFAMSWGKKIKSGERYDEVISALDIYATCVEAANINIKECTNKLDGVNLLPYINGKKRGAPHESLFWRVGNGFEYAVRKGDYKLVKTYYSDEYMLFNIAKDPMEMIDIAKYNAKLVCELSADYKRWNSEMIDAQWGTDGHEQNQRKDYEKWSEYRRRAAAGR